MWGKKLTAILQRRKKILSPGSDNSPYFFISLIGKKYRSNRPITCPEPGLSRCCLQHHGELHSARGRGQRSGQTPSVRPSIRPAAPEGPRYRPLRYGLCFPGHKPKPLQRAKSFCTYVYRLLAWCTKYKPQFLLVLLFKKFFPKYCNLV